MSIDGDMEKYLEYVTDFVQSLDIPQYGILPMVDQITTSGYGDTNVDVLEISISFHIA
jgi:hypothetical protein